jgi:hypothetical protein
MPSAMNTRDFVDFLRRSFTSFYAGELSQALAFSTLSKAMTTNRLGGVPSRPAML